MNQARAYRTRAIVLRSRNLGEANKIYVLFTQERGKIDAVAKGIRRTRSHLGGKLEFASEVLVMLHHGRSLDVITSADVLSSRWDAIARPGAFAAAQLLAELIDAFCEPAQPEPEVYALLSGALRALAASDEPATVAPRFELRLLAALGLGPPDECVRCGACLDGARAYADLEAGGLACERCRSHHADLFALEPADVASFRALAAPRGVQLSAPRASLVATPAAARAADALVAHHLGKRPKSRAIVEELAVNG